MNKAELPMNQEQNRFSRRTFLRGVGGLGLGVALRGHESAEASFSKNSNNSIESANLPSESLSTLSENDFGIPEAIYENREALLSILPDIEIEVVGPVNATESFPGDTQIQLNKNLSSDEAIARAKLIYAGTVIRIMDQAKKFGVEGAVTPEPGTQTPTSEAPTAAPSTATPESEVINIGDLTTFMSGGNFPDEPDYAEGVRELLENEDLIIPIMAVPEGMPRDRNNVVLVGFNPRKKHKLVISGSMEKEVFTNYDDTMYEGSQDVGSSYVVGEDGGLTTYSVMHIPEDNADYRNIYYSALLVQANVPLEMTLGAVDPDKNTLYGRWAQMYGPDMEKYRRYIYSDLDRYEYKLAYGTSDPSNLAEQRVPILTC